MNKPVVLFDADGVLLDFITPALAVANAIVRQADYYECEEGIYKNGTKIPFVPYTVESLHTWDIFDVIGRAHEADCYAEYEKPGWCAAIKPYPEAVDGMRKARELADVVVVTSPLHSPTWCHERVWALHNYFGIQRRNVIFASRKSLVKGRMLVDDNPKHVHEWAEAHFKDGSQGVLWSQPYNRDALGDHRLSYTRYVDNWTELLDIIEQL